MLPGNVIAEREILHPVIDAEFVRAQPALRKMLGRDNLDLAGSYTDGMDSQETAYRSAQFVAKLLAPKAVGRELS